MKITMKMTGADVIQGALEEMGLLFPKKLNDNLKNSAIDLAKRAREILKFKSEEHTATTGNSYWTGNLSNSIQSNVDYEDTKKISVSVGVDPNSANYAEWVEFGHFIVSYGNTLPSQIKGVASGNFDWWEGYHYMELAYIEYKDKLQSDFLAKTKLELENYARTINQRTRHLSTGRFIKGFSNNG